MRYIANPVEVDAQRITGIEERTDNGCVLQLENMDTVLATPEMLARMTPKVGDYWVIQQDGYIYLNPKEVFERKYRKAPGQADEDSPEPMKPYFTS